MRPCTPVLAFALAGCLLGWSGTTGPANPVKQNGWLMNNLEAAQDEAQDWQADLRRFPLRGLKGLPRFRRTGCPWRQKDRGEVQGLRPAAPTYLRLVNIALFVYDYDQTWMAFFLDADLRIYSRYGCRDASSADSHNSAEGLFSTMVEVLAIHKEESGKVQPPPKLPKAVVPTDLPELADLRYNGSCVRCHMVHETQYLRQQSGHLSSPLAVALSFAGQRRYQA